MLGVIFQHDANQSFLRCDHMCLAPSVIDATPGVMHGVLSHSSAQSRFDFITCHKLKPKVIEDAGEGIHLDVSLPECDVRKMVRHVHVIVLAQQVSDADCKRLNYHRLNNFPADAIVDLWLFGGDYMREDADGTIVLGKFVLEGKSILPEFLFVAWNGMLVNKQRDLPNKQRIAEDVYGAVWSLSGKRSYEMRQFDGSSGLIDNVTNKNVLRALAVSKGSLPRKSWDAVII